MTTKPRNQEENLVKDPLEAINVTEQLLAAPYGQQGATVIVTTGAEHWVNGYCMVAIEDGTQIDASNCDTNWQEDKNSSVTQDLETDLNLPTGVPFYGDFRRIFLLSGKVIIYHR